MNKVYYTDQDVRSWVHHIIRSMNDEGWRPDYIVGLTRGGLVPANMLSQYLNIKMYTLNVSLRDNNNTESNLWMSEDAFGYAGHGASGLTADENKEFDYALHAKKILIVDDINDSGATLNWIKQDWTNSCLPNNRRWDSVWHDNVRFAVLITNRASDFRDPDYVGKIIDKREQDEWCVFPWEAWFEV